MLDTFLHNLLFQVDITENMIFDFFYIYLVRVVLIYLQNELFGKVRSFLFSENVLPHK
jgi:hypothetical protein